jgi:hypothetical protein
MAVYTTIDDAGSFYSTKIYTGTGSSNAQTGVGFQPDFTWIKNRDVADFHVLTDSVRGATKYLICDANTTETTNTESLKSFDSDGFTVGTQNEVNTNTEDFVAWNWKAGTTTGIAGSPSITPSSYSFNATSGFSAIAYTGTGSVATLPHGLGVAPAVIITKRLDATNGWAVYHQSLGNTQYLGLDETTGATTSTDFWNDTSPTSTLFTVATNGDVNASSGTYIAYCFAEIKGYSKFGSYIGNGNADGAFVYTGFRPAFFMLKKSSGPDQGWLIVDDKRGYNTSNDKMYADSTAAETLKANSLLSNGWKVEEASDTYNETGATYIYAAFAEAPFVNSSGVPVNAR